MKAEALGEDLVSFFNDFFKNVFSFEGEQKGTKQNIKDINADKLYGSVNFFL